MPYRASNVAYLAATPTGLVGKLTIVADKAGGGGCHCQLAMGVLSTALSVMAVTSVSLVIRGSGGGGGWRSSPVAPACGYAR